MFTFLGINPPIHHEFAMGRRQWVCFFLRPKCDSHREELRCDRQVVREAQVDPLPTQSVDPFLGGSGLPHKTRTGGQFGSPELFQGNGGQILHPDGPWNICGTDVRWFLFFSFRKKNTDARVSRSPGGRAVVRTYQQRLKGPIDRLIGTPLRSCP